MTILHTLYKYLRFWGGNFKCNVCQTPVRRFFPLSTELQHKAKSNGFPYDFKRMETLNYEQCNCPFCLSSDRERLYLIYIEQYLNDLNKKYAILDFAPTPAFSKNLKSRNHNYTSTDLFRDDVDLKMDICNMHTVNDNTYDLIICSHVLEHVPDPDKAMREIRRVMRPDGKAIIMVPLFWDVKETQEDKSHITDELRLKHYGQDDHVRLFSQQDFLSRLQSASFKIDQLKPADFHKKKIVENAIADNTILYVCSKN